ncbi:hypothetical protein Glove_117g208 [Diversispora epigaea]|uniref:Uncharacterized protein n=1 Tax=Diversispora epigaea TaxID=1348612 RepID=A0A397J6M8_9GLOM|nr:hypothetical protein Glove_117g208 [Diversispora epigaea]
MFAEKTHFQIPVILFQIYMECLLVVSRSIQVKISTACTLEMIVEKDSFSSFGSSARGGNSVTKTDLASKIIDFTGCLIINFDQYLSKVVYQESFHKV